MRLIDADLLLNTLTQIERGWSYTYEYMKAIVDDQPSVSMDPVKPIYRQYAGAWLCGNCSNLLHGEDRYCSYCGRRVLWEVKRK